ncbi:Glycerophosphoryl diester phosphodiesterase [hydrothermal vent metagenome]|uniref:Glycerophosphoryl diester phosphodiesterase n=1 Tax=hydrothermal vent metagenome TaxID=652676 RepID=A0A3B0RFU9_9ZZZZ
MRKSTKSIEWLKARPIAHRGLHDSERGVLENTRTAFDLAISGNYTIECDLQISTDGEAMVFHDPNLARLTTGKEDVNQLTAAQLQEVSFRDTSDKIQTLAELLQQTNGRVPLVIEIKSLVDGDMTIAQRTLEVLSSYTGDYAIMSFAPMLMQTIKNQSPQTLRGGVVGPKTENLWLQTSGKGETVLDTIDLDFVSYDVRGLPSAFVDNFRSPTKPVISWTIKDQKTADFAQKYCDQITFEGFTPK